MQLAVYCAFLLLIRWVFYLSPRQKHITHYGLKALVEIGLFLLLYSAKLSIFLSVSGLLIVLNLFCYVLEVKVFQSDGGKDRLQKLELLVGLAVYAAAFILIFRSGTIDGFSGAVAGWAANRRVLSSARFFYLIIGGFLAVSEAEHVSRFLRVRFAKESATAVSRNGIFQAAGYAERAAIIVLILISQFTAAGIIAAGRLISTGWFADRESHAALTMLSLAWAIIFSLALKSIAHNINF